MFADMSLDSILRQLSENPEFAITACVAIVQFIKDQWGINGKQIYYLGVAPAALVLSLARFFGPYAVGPFDFGDWLYNGIVIGVGSVVGWAFVKGFFHKWNGTRPSAQTAKMNGNGNGTKVETQHVKEGS